MARFLVIFIIVRSLHTALEYLIRLGSFEVVRLYFGREKLNTSAKWLNSLLERQCGHYLWLADLLRRHAGAGRPPVRIGPSDPAMLMFTGGTTGRSKVALSTHGGLLAAAMQIRAWLAGHSAVSEVGVAGIPDELRGEAVKAWVVLLPGKMVTAADLRAYCRQHLAPYKVPRHIEFCDSLPKSAVGKVLRRKLGEQEQTVPAVKSLARETVNEELSGREREPTT